MPPPKKLIRPTASSQGGRERGRETRGLPAVGRSGVPGSPRASPSVRARAWPAGAAGSEPARSSPVVRSEQIADRPVPLRYGRMGEGPVTGVTPPVAEIVAVIDHKRGLALRALDGGRRLPLDAGDIALLTAGTR